MVEEIISPCVTAGFAAFRYAGETTVVGGFGDTGGIVQTLL